MMKDWVRPEIAALSAYHVPAAGDWVKLDAMENPYPWPEDLQKQWLDALPEVELNRYPDPAAHQLTAELCKVMDVPEGYEIVLGNGSDELIQLLMMVVAAPGRKILAPEPTFVMYEMIAKFVGMAFVGVPLDGEFNLDLDTMVAAIEQHQPAVTFLAYPNNPTGNLFDRAAVEKILEVAEGFVVVDEAYHVFAEESFMSELPNHENLLVMRTVSKMGLAGLRLGLMAGDPRWINEINKVRLPYNINVLTQHAATFILRHAEVLEAQAVTLREEREKLLQALESIDGVVQVYPSRANFILFRVAEGQATPLFEVMKVGGVLVKNLSPAGGALVDTIRVTVSRSEENRQFLDALSAGLMSIK